jgi:hypothetical protein
MSIAHLDDKLDVEDINLLYNNPANADNATNSLLKFFSPEQAALIESAYEGYPDNTYPWSRELTGNWYYNMLIKGIGDATANYYDKYEYAEDNLIAIMNNIISNKGTFIPTK